MRKSAFSILFVALFLKMADAQNTPTAQPKPTEKPKTETSLLDFLGEEKTVERMTNAFKGTRVINAHSIEMLAPGTMDFRILHRFGEVGGGRYEMFGLDQASMRMGFDFGIGANTSVGFGRSTAKKEKDVFLKKRLMWQSKGLKKRPFSIVWVSGMTVNGLRNATGFDEVPTTFRRRLGYYHELIVGRKFSEKFSLQVAPTLVHHNIVPDRLMSNDLFAVSVGGRYKFTKRMAVVWDYAHALNRFPANATFNPLSLGIDIETGGHVFQLHFSNAVGMNERAYISDSNGNWLESGVRFGFNLSRVFQLKKRKID